MFIYFGVHVCVCVVSVSAYSMNIFQSNKYIDDISHLEWMVPKNVAMTKIKSKPEINPTQIEEKFNQIYTQKYGWWTSNERVEQPNKLFAHENIYDILVVHISM